MSYAQNNTTLIDDLPSLDELEMPKSYGLSMIPETEMNKYQKFVRNNGHSPPTESGMGFKNNHHQSSKSSNNHIENHNNQYNQNNQNNQYNPYEAEIIHENFEENSHKHEHGTSNCVDVAEHTSSCLVCSRLYTNNNTVFILMIIFLAIVNLLLLKRILETA